MKIGPMYATAVVLMISVACVRADRPIQNNPVQLGQLNSAIGPANAKLYKGVRDWANPWLVIRPDGIEITAKAIPSGRRIVVAADLKRTLIELPLDAWPYGRAVVLYDLLGPMDPEAAKKLVASILATLKDLQITIETCSTC
jgi:hypothetical protein